MTSGAPAIAMAIRRTAAGTPPRNARSASYPIVTPLHKWLLIPVRRRLADREWPHVQPFEEIYGREA